MTLVVMMAVELQHMMMVLMMMMAVWVVLGVLDMHSATGASV